MNITYRGKTATERVWVGSCAGCGSKAEATESELTHITHDQREGGSFSWEKCPVCGKGSNTGYDGMLFYPRKAA